MKIERARLSGPHPRQLPLEQLDDVPLHIDVLAPLFDRLRDVAAHEGRVAVGAAKTAAGVRVDDVVDAAEPGLDERRAGFHLDHTHASMLAGRARRRLFGSEFLPAAKIGTEPAHRRVLFVASCGYCRTTPREGGSGEGEE